MSLVKVRIGGRLFNANYLAYPTELLGDGPVTLWINPDPKLAAHFYGIGFRVVLMPLRDDNPDVVLAGEFDLSSALRSSRSGEQR